MQQYVTYDNLISLLILIATVIGVVLSNRKHKK